MTNQQGLRSRIAHIIFDRVRIEEWKETTDYTRKYYLITADFIIAEITKALKRRRSKCQTK
jgi:hypothetical protein